MKSSATGRTISPTRLVSSSSITSTMSEENSAASTLRASLSSNRVKSSAFKPSAGLPDLASTTVTETRLAAASGSAPSSARTNRLVFNFDLHARVEPGDLGGGDTIAFADTVHDFGVGPE